MFHPPATSMCTIAWAAATALPAASSTDCSPANQPTKPSSSAGHGALLTTTPGDTTMVTLEQVKAFAKGGSARIQR